MYGLRGGRLDSHLTDIFRTSCFRVLYALTSHPVPLGDGMDKLFSPQTADVAPIPVLQGGYIVKVSSFFFSWAGILNAMFLTYCIQNVTDD